MNIEERTAAFAVIGKQLRALGTADADPYLERAAAEAGRYNAWFTPENTGHALARWGRLLQEENLRRWLEPYAARPGKVRRKTVAVVLPGNIPLAGFHDVLAVLLAGHRLLYKPSSGDSHLLPALVRMLPDTGTGFPLETEEAAGTLKGFDAVIATGGSNTSRYFRHYFGRYPHIIRGSRNAAALLAGDETGEELTSLGGDISRYFGMGCRSVSKLFVPEDYDFQPLLDALAPHAHVMDHRKYRNNYDYNKTLMLMNRIPHLDPGFLLIREDRRTATPVSVLHYERYKGQEELTTRLGGISGELQCMVSSGRNSLPGIPFGTAQSPELWDYADGVDTLDFLLGL